MTDQHCQSFDTDSVTLEDMVKKFRQLTTNEPTPKPGRIIPEGEKLSIYETKFIKDFRALVDRLLPQLEFFEPTSRANILDALQKLLHSVDTLVEDPSNGVFITQYWKDMRELIEMLDPGLNESADSQDLERPEA